MALHVLPGVERLGKTPHERAVRFEPVFVKVLLRNVGPFPDNVNQFDHQSHLVGGNRGNSLPADHVDLPEASIPENRLACGIQFRRPASGLGPRYFPGPGATPASLIRASARSVRSCRALSANSPSTKSADTR